MQKKIALNLIFLISLSVNAYALPLKDAVFSVSTPQTFIHVTHIKTEGKVIKGAAILEVGKGNQYSCNIEKKVIKEPMEFIDNMELNVDGSLLATMVGLDYTCAKETYMLPHGPGGSVIYAIFKNGSAYIKADPDHHEVTLHDGD